MAEHDVADADAVTPAPADRPRRWRPTGRRAANRVTLAALVALGVVGSRLGHQVLQVRQEQAQRDEFVSAARQAAINLTTIKFDSVDADTQRILDSSTGTFHEDFKRRSDPFAEVVRQARSVSEGTVAGAGLQTMDGDRAEVLVVMSVRMVTADNPDEQPRSWRMRIGMQKTDGGVPKMSDVQFVQ